MFNERKRRQEEERRQQQLLADLQDEHSDAPAPQVKAFIRADVVNANKSIGGTTPSLYKPNMPNALLQAAKEAKRRSEAVDTFEDAKKLAAERARRMMAEAGKSDVVVKPAQGMVRPPKPGSKTAVAAKSKTSNLEEFKEHLKLVQQERERSKQKSHGHAERGDVARTVAPVDQGHTSLSVHDDHGPETTNLYVNHLPLDCTDADLFDTFGSFGPLASVKVLYPRPDETVPRMYLCGFVAFMTRRDAERAVEGMQGYNLRGFFLKTSWARPVPTLCEPIYVPPDLAKLAFPDPPSGLPFNAQPIPGTLALFLKKHSALPRLSDPPPSSDADEVWRDYLQMVSTATVRVVVPTDRHVLQLIHRIIEHVIREGPLFELAVMHAERENPAYRFLFDNHQPAHVYYRWKMFSIMQGDSLDSWRIERFRMFENGPWWKPPPVGLFHAGMPKELYYLACNLRADILEGADKDGAKGRSTRKSVSPEGRRKRRRGSSGSATDEEDEEALRKRGILSSRERTALEELLRALTPERAAVGEAMVWCLDHAVCAREVVDCIVESLTIDETPLSKKIARFYLVSDILANAAQRGMRDVFYYREYFQEQLETIFLALKRAYQLVDARLKAEHFKKRVLDTFQAWSAETLYPTEQLIYHQNIFLGLIEPVVTAAGKGKDDEDGDAKGGEEDDIDGVPLPPKRKPIGELEGNGRRHDREDDDDIDGVPIGAPTTSRTYGQREVVAEEAFDNDGDDIDGVPLEQAAPDRRPQQKRPAVEMKFKPIGLQPSSKWDSDDEEDERRRPPPPKLPPKSVNMFADEEADRTAESRWSMASPPHVRSSNNQSASQKSVDKNQAMSDERRRQMREIEVKVMALQDELECEGVSDVREQVEKYRQSLLRRLEEEADEGEVFEEKSGGGTKRHADAKEKDKRSRESTRRRSRSRSRSRSRGRRRSRSRSRDRGKKSGRK